MFGTTSTVLLAALLSQAPAAPAPASPAAAACKAHGGGPCCDPAVSQHLPQRAVFAACRETAETFLGERGSKDTCRYVFKVGKADADTAFVEVYAPAQKQVPDQPTDPFFAWSKVGKAFVTTRAKSPKSAPMLAAATGIWLPGLGYAVSVNASTKVCSRSEAQKLAKLVK